MNVNYKKGKEQLEKPALSSWSLSSSPARDFIFDSISYLVTTLISVSKEYKWGRTFHITRFGTHIEKR